VGEANNVRVGGRYQVELQNPQDGVVVVTVYFFTRRPQWALNDR
jgi:hypothetical protein